MIKNHNLNWNVFVIGGLGFGAISYSIYFIVYTILCFFDGVPVAKAIVFWAEREPFAVAFNCFVGCMFGWRRWFLMTRQSPH